MPYFSGKSLDTGFGGPLPAGRIGAGAADQNREFMSTATPIANAPIFIAW